MLTKLLVAPLFIAASAVAHPAVQLQRRADADVPLSSWSSGGLESYWRFKNRYNSLGCSSQVGTDFYTNCCYPLGASESLSDRPAECTPASLTCGSPVVTTPTPAPAPAPAPETFTPESYAPADTSSSSDNYDESTLPWCEAGQDEYDDDTYTDESWNNGGSSSDTYTPPASDNSQAQPTDGGNSGNTGGDTSVGNWIGGGMATYYYQNGNAGACGDVNPDSAMIGAIDHTWYGDMGQRSQYCGRSVRIKNVNNGRTVDIVVADVCPTCATDNSFDLSEGAFKVLDELSTGTFPIEWTFL